MAAAVEPRARPFTADDLFDAVESSSVSTRPLIQFLFKATTNGRSAAKTREAALSAVKTFHKPKARRLFAGLLPILEKIVEEESILPDQTDEDDGGGASSDVDATDAVLFLKGCACLTGAYLEGLTSRNTRKSANQPSEIIDEAFEVAELLHDQLFPLHSLATKEATQTQREIFNVCERWWHGNFDDREQLVTQLVPLLLVKSLDDNSEKNDVKRLYSIRSAIDLLDFEDESITSLKNHLLRTVGNPLFLQTSEGKKFIQHLFGVDKTLADELHKAVKVQLIGAKKSLLTAYADIYYGVWKLAIEQSGDESCDDEEDKTATLQSIEEAIQDLVYHALHSANPSTVKQVKGILDKFYQNKKNPAVEKMLHDLISPLLWRALNSTNSRVRLQASAVLADTFPLRDPTNETQTQAIVAKSVESLSRLMEDDVPCVRVSGCKASAEILAEFWVAIPIADIRTLLNHIIAKHACDTKSAAVRAEAVKAVTSLLAEEKTHAVLRPLLPSMGNLINDKTERVRVAVVDMLLVIKKLRGIKYYNVCPAKSLLARLADEGRGRNNPTGPVARGLSNLLSNSFFPSGSKKTLTDVINRTMRLLSDSPQAAVTFYRNASSQLSVNSICKLTAVLMKCLCYFIVEEKKVRGEDETDLSLVFDDEAIDCKKHASTALMATVCESISILWDTIETELKDEQNHPCMEILADVFSGNVLKEVYCFFESSRSTDVAASDGSTVAADCYRACVAILNCAGKMDESRIDGLRSHIISQLVMSRDMPGEQRKRSNYSSDVALLCAWGMTEEVANCLSKSITHYFENGVQKKRAGVKRKARNKKEQNLSDQVLDIDVCLGILGHLLQGSNPLSVTARESLLSSDRSYSAITSALGSTQRYIDQELASREKLDNDKIRNFGLAIECYGRLLIHKEASQNEGNVPLHLPAELKCLLDWAANSILPSIENAFNDQNPLRELDLSGIEPISPTGVCRRSASSIEGSFFTGQEDSNVLKDVDLDSIRAVSITVLSSALHSTIDWLSIRQVGDSAISSDIMPRFAKLIDCSDAQVRTSILPILLRYINTSLANHDEDAAVLKLVLSSLKANESNDVDNEVVRCAVSRWLVLRDEYSLRVAVATVIHSIRSTAFCTDDDETLLECFGEVTRDILLTIMADRRGSLHLARVLRAEPQESLFREQLVKALSLHAPKSKQLLSILSELNPNSLGGKDVETNNSAVVENRESSGDGEGLEVEEAEKTKISSRFSGSPVDGENTNVMNTVQDDMRQ